MPPESRLPRRTRIFVGLFAVALTLVGCAGGCEPKPPVTQADDEGTPRVRVRLMAGVPRCTLSADGPAVILDEIARKPLPLTLPAGRPTDWTMADDNWQAGGRAAEGVMLRVQPDAGGTVAVNGQPYRGAITLVPAGGGKFDVVNDVDVEDYLRGVLAKELLPDWHAEAYRAQAVIARTYALYEARTNPAGRTWDLYADERSQVYGGAAAETAKANDAVAATRGVVTAFGSAGQERIFKAYFSSCCGGTTASAADVFNEPAIAPLSSKSNGTTCSISPRFNWPPVTLSKAELTRRFRAWGTKMSRPEAKLPGVASITIASLNPFGRPRGYLVTDTRGQQYALTAEQLRWAINADAAGGPTVFSGFFRPVDAGDGIRFADGHGFGHGVGACQWCMQARALAGRPFADIVTQAYPQAVLVRAY